ncbi:MAG: hypothetical protein M0Q15_15700 [Nevskia sp.]|jgi:hypothetical protein|nr:hypothetical protein [Nevskia sp.]
MPTYFLDIEATPTSAAANASDVASASVLTFVIAGSPAEAEAMARAAIMGQGWVAQSISSFLQPTDEQISRLGTEEKMLYQLALLHGIGQYFLAYPKSPGHPGDPIQIRSLCSPVIDEVTKH